jgi:hypothetical protein
MLSPQSLESIWQRDRNFLHALKDFHKKIYAMDDREVLMSFPNCGYNRDCWCRGVVSDNCVQAG